MVRRVPSSMFQRILHFHSIAVCTYSLNLSVIQNVFMSSHVVTYSTKETWKILKWFHVHKLSFFNKWTHFCIVFLSESHRLIAPNLAGHKKRHLILNIFFCHLMLNILLVSFFNNKIKNLQKSCFQKSEQISSNCSLSIYFLSHLYSSTTTYPLYMVIYISNPYSFKKKKKPLLFNQLISWYWNLKHVTDDMAYTYGRHMVWHGLLHIIVPKTCL